MQNWAILSTSIQEAFIITTCTGIQIETKQNNWTYWHIINQIYFFMSSTLAITCFTWFGIKFTRLWHILSSPSWNYIFLTLAIKDSFDKSTFIQLALFKPNQFSMVLKSCKFPSNLKYTHWLHHEKHFFKWQELTTNFQLF